MQKRAALVPIWLLALLLALGLRGSASAQVEEENEVREEGSVEEEITVIETSLLLDFHDLLEPRQVRRLEPSAVRIAEDDVPRETLRLTPVLRRNEDRWHILIYVDAGLARAETVRQAAASLGQHVSSLVRLGAVRIVVCDDEPRDLVPASRSVTVLEDALAELAKRPIAFDRVNGLRQRYTAVLAREGSDAFEPRIAALNREVELVRRQADHLLRTVGNGCPADACALFLVSDGFEVNPEAYYLGQAWTAAHPESGIQAERTAVDLAESLSALEWITIALPLRPPPGPADAEDRPRGDTPSSDFERFSRAAGSHFDGISIRRRNRTLDRLPVESFAVYLLPALQPLRMLADETSGAIVRNPELLDGEIRRLGERWRVWYRTTRSLDGAVRPVEAYLTKSGKAIRAPLWIDGSTPPGVAAARARSLLDGHRSPPEVRQRLELDAATRTVTGDGRTLDLTVGWPADSPAHASSARVPLRISVAYRTPERNLEVHHRVFDIEAQPGVTETELEIEVPVPAGIADAAILVEELRYRTWGVTRLAAAR